MRGLVLTYHSQNCGGYDYSTNDHHAFEQDLQAVYEQGLPIIPLKEIAQNLSRGTPQQLPRRFVAFSCDDGTLLDWFDYQHPQFGLQRSFANILREHLSTHGPGGNGLLTSFVIASAAARASIDLGCYDGAQLSTEDWWPDAVREGLIDIENHSWDHVHPVLPAEVLAPDAAGNFYSINDYSGADMQVRRASQCIDERLAGTGHQVSLFAYPYGHAGAFLSESYLPRYQAEHGIVGAFTTEQNFVDAATQPFRIPRMVCGDAWRTPQDFAVLLQRLLE